MGNIIGDLSKDIGKGLSKLSDGDVIEGVGDIVGGTIECTRRTASYTLKTIGNVANNVGDAINGLTDDGVNTQPSEKSQ